MTPRENRTKFACDQCRFRKMKCDGDHPCSRCLKMKFDCSFKHDRSVKAQRGRRVEMLREIQLPPQPDAFVNKETHSPKQPSSTFESPPEHARLPLGISPKEGIESYNHNLHPAAASAANPDGPGNTVDQDESSTSWVEPSQDQHLDPPTIPFEPQLERMNSYQSTTVQTQASPGSQISQKTHFQSPSITAPSVWPIQFEEKDILQWIDVFFDRMHSTLPVVDRDLYRDLMLRRHHTDKEFAALILALCSVAVVGPVYQKERILMPARIELAKNMMTSAAHLRTSYDFGEQPNLEAATVTSFFMFAALFSMGRQKAAWLRLRESVECGRLLGLHQPETYEPYTALEKGRRLRIFLILSVSERGFALQRNHYISFTGPTTEKMAEIYRSALTAEHKSASSIAIHDDKIISTLLGLQQLMKLFDSVDEQVIPCWNKSCSPSLSNCARLTVDRVQKVFASIEDALKPQVEDCSLQSVVSRRSSQMQNQQFVPKHLLPLTDAQWADCYVLQQWLLTRLWVACMTHDALTESSSLAFMRPSYVTSIADRVLDECNRLGDTVLEIHGAGMVERLYDIAMGVLMCLQFYASSSSNADNQKSHMILHRYFDLVGRLGGSEHPCAVALRRAYETYLIEAGEIQV